MKTVILVFFFLITGSGCFAQGKYAGTKANLIGTTYLDSRNIRGLENWEYRSGSVISQMDDPEMIIACVFQKGNTLICFFSNKEDTTAEMLTILDVIEIKNVLKGWQLYTTSCRQNMVENAAIVALVKWSPAQEILKPAQKAWRFNRDKRMFEIMSIRGIDCINEGLD